MKGSSRCPESRRKKNQEGSRARGQPRPRPLTRLARASLLSRTAAISSSRTAASPRCCGRLSRKRSCAMRRSGFLGRPSSSRFSSGISTAERMIQGRTKLYDYPQGRRKREKSPSAPGSRQPGFRSRHYLHQLATPAGNIPQRLTPAGAGAQQRLADHCRSSPPRKCPTPKFDFVNLFLHLFSPFIFHSVCNR